MKVNKRNIFLTILVVCMAGSLYYIHQTSYTQIEQVNREFEKSFDSNNMFIEIDADSLFHLIIANPNFYIDSPNVTNNEKVLIPFDRMEWENFQREYLKNWNFDDRISREKGIIVNKEEGFISFPVNKHSNKRYATVPIVFLAGLLKR